MGATPKDKKPTKRTTMKPTKTVSSSRVCVSKLSDRRIKGARNETDEKKPATKKARRAKSNRKPIYKLPTFSSLSQEAWRPAHKMPAIVPCRRKAKHVIAVVGNEIKVLGPKRRRMADSRLCAPKGSTKNTTDGVKGGASSDKKQSAECKVTRQMSKKGTNECQKVASIKSKRLRVKEDAMSLDNTVSEDHTWCSGNLGEVVRLGKKRDVTGERRKKCELYSKPSDAKLSTEKLDPITNVVTTEYVKSVDRCDSLYDLVTCPKPSPKPSMYSRVHFQDTTMIEEFNFPPIDAFQNTSSRVPELPLVPPMLPEGSKRSLSWPIIEGVGTRRKSHLSDSRADYLDWKPKPKFETIFMARPMSFPKKKWFYENVASESNAKIKLLYDVIMSQVKKILKRHAAKNATSNKV